MSAKRRLICSRENAIRVAERIFEAAGGPVSIVRTDDPQQPIRVASDPPREDRVELAMVL